MHVYKSLENGVFLLLASCILHKTCTVTMFGTPTPNIFCWEKVPCAVLSLPLPEFRLLPSLPEMQENRVSLTAIPTSLVNTAL